ncbi:MAG: hypothetical protein ACTSQG_05065, partial [Promethearchaeota archaeon]
IENKISFINISTEDLSLFEWKPRGSFKSFTLDMNIVKENIITEDVFFHINKGNMKLAYIKKKKLLYTVGSEKDVQFQLLEALLEEIDKKFNDIYDIEVILSYDNVSENIFKNFQIEVDEIIKNFSKLDIVKKVDIFCKVCKKKFPLFIKKSVIKESPTFPVPIVYSHKGHALVCYIDRNYVLRGVELVNITG